MTEDTTPPADAADTDAPAAAAPIKMQILAQFIRDLSFENVLAQKGAPGDVQPDTQLQIAIDAKKRQADTQYECILKFRVESKDKANGSALFLVELEYAGVFAIENVPEARLHPCLMIECPRMLFPFGRRIVSDVTRDGGFPALNLDMVDFVTLYRQQLAQRAAVQGADTAKPN